MTAVRAWLRSDLRGRARSLVVLALLIGVTTGVVLTATAGARRGNTAVPRLLERTLPATVAALPNEPGFDWDAVSALPNVEAVGRFAVAEFGLDGVPGENLGFPFGRGTMIDIERPVILEGRLADEDRVGEGVVSAAFEDSFGKGVGDTVTMRLFTPEQVDLESSGGDAGDPAGPVIEVTIVGIVRSPWFSDTGDAAGGFAPSNALLEQYEPYLIGAEGSGSINALIRLDGGKGSIAQFREDLAELTGRRDIEFMDLAEQAEHAHEVAGFEAKALLAFAMAALVAAVFLVGQSVVRFVSASTQDLQILGAVGMPPRHIRLAAATGPVLAAVGGAVLGVAGAYAASDRFPIGTAEPIEPTPGRDADVTVFVVGAVAIVALIGVGSLLASWSASRSLGKARTRHSSLADIVARAGAPVPLTVGTSFALDRGRGSQAVPVYPALIGAVVGVLGVVAALTFAAGVDDAAEHPERFGQIGELQAFVGLSDEDFLAVDEVLEAIAADPEVAAVNDTRQGVLESGAVDMATFVIDPVDAPPPIVVLDGRLPSESDEVAVATETAKKLNAGVGDVIELAGSAGSGDYRISGIAFVPEGPHNGYDEGAWVLPASYDELIDGFKFHTIEIDLEDGADPQEAAARIGPDAAVAAGLPAEASADLLGVRSPPSRLSELKEVQTLPLYLAGFLALMAVAAVGHALATAVRRRRHDLAVLRAVGVTRWQSRSIVLVQATVLALCGLGFGVPLGFALGRTLWRSVADTTPLDYVPPVAVWALLLITPIVLLGANLLAAWPSHRAASLRVAHVLRTE